MMRRAISSLVFVVVVGLVTAVPAAGQCRVTDLGSLGAYTGGEARGINQKGEVVGSVWNPYRDPYASSDVFRGFLWKKGTISDIGSLAEIGPTNPDNAVVALAINDHGQIVGFANAADSTQTAFIWERGSFRELVSIPSDPPTAAYSHAWAINNRSQVAGTNYQSPYGHPRGFLWENGVARELAPPEAEGMTAAYGINDRGDVVGDSEIYYAGTRHAVLWRGDAVIDLGTLGGDYSVAFGVNNKQQVVGHAQMATGSWRAFLWENGVMIDLGTLPGGDDSIAYAINEKGDIVGSATTAEAPGVPYPVIWRRGVISRLVDIPGVALGLNNNGAVVGSQWFPVAESARYDVRPAMWSDCAR